MRNLFTLLLFSIIGLQAFSQEKPKVKVVQGDTIAIVEHALKKVDKNVNFTVIPGPVYNATQKLGFAVLPMIVYNINKKDSISPPSSTAVLFYFDFYGSWAVAAKQSFYWRKDLWRAFITVGYGDIKSKFYGVGRDKEIINNNDSNYVWAYQKPASFNLTCYHKIISHFYGGLELSYFNNYFDGKDSTAAAEIEQSGVPVGKNIQTRIIPAFVWDNRNNVFWSTHGYYSKLTFQYSNKFLFSDNDFYVLTAYVSGYYSLLPGSKRLSLAWRMFMQGGWGDVPYDQYANYCRGDDATGYTPGKYVNFSEANTQVEVRYDLWKFIAFSAYVGTGKIFGSIFNFGQSKWLNFAGANMYINLIPYRDIRMRLGIAIGRSDYGLYVGLGQMF